MDLRSEGEKNVYRKDSGNQGFVISESFFVVSKSRPKELGLQVNTTICDTQLLHVPVSYSLNLWSFDATKRFDTGSNGFLSFRTNSLAVRHQLWCIIFHFCFAFSFRPFKFSPLILFCVLAMFLLPSYGARYILPEQSTLSCYRPLYYWIILQVRVMDRWLHPRLSRILPTDVDLQAGTHNATHPYQFPHK
jgi:hypothetical protein